MRVWPPSVRMLLLPTENVKTPVGMPRRWQTGGGRTAGLPIGLGRWLLAGISLIPALGRAEGGPDLARLQGWAIAVATNAPAVEHYAAEELQTHLETATGHRLPLVKPDASDGFEGLVLVGTQASGLATDELGQEGTRWIADADRIRLAGGHPRGTLYAVYDFLESALGVRFLTPEHTHIPPVGEALPLVRGERRFVPPLDFRWSYYGEVNANPVFAARLRNNTVALDERLGGKTSTGLINHSFSRYVPWARYGASNPEYFNEIGGKRPSETINDHEGPGVQLCLTNPDVLQKVIEGVLADLKHAPRSRNISVSPNDNLQYCRCDACRTVDAREGSPSGTLFTFVNAVAEAVEPHYPDVLVGTLAYKYSRRPPLQLRLRPNVQIQLCSIEACMNHAIADPDCPLNVPFARDLRDWSALTDNVNIWHYNVNFADYLLPCPNLRTIAPNLRFFVAHNAKGVFMQGAGNGRGTEFAGLRNYMMSRLLWNPELDGDVLRDEFLHLHYGAAAAEPIRQFLELSHDTVESSGRHQRCSRPARDYGLNEAVADAGMALFEDAIKVAGNETNRQRVEKASITALALKIEPVSWPVFWACRQQIHRGPDVRASVDPAIMERLRPYVALYLERTRRHGVTMANERVSMDQARAEFRRLYGIPQGAPFE